MDTKILVFVLLTLVGGSICQLHCYACGFSSVDSDRSCLTITETTRTVECPFKYCTILRQEFLDPVGVVASFSRGCDDHPDFLNHEVTDSTFRTFYRACTTDLCNIGNGIQSVIGGGLSPHPEYNGRNLLVPGTGHRSLRILMPLSYWMWYIFICLENINNDPDNDASLPVCILDWKVIGNIDVTTFKTEIYQYTYIVLQDTKSKPSFDIFR